MRTKRTIATLGGAVALVLALGVCAARAEEEAAAPTDPTRGQWDSFLDPLRDFEDEYVTGTQKKIEDATGIHVMGAIQKGFTYDFNRPPSGTALPYDSFLTNTSPSVDIGQLRFNRPSDGWFIPGFGTTLTFGKAARRIKADWDGDGAIDRGDIFETNNFDAEEAYLTWAVPDDGPSFLKGLTLKGGKFVTLLGSEVIEPWANFNNSRSLLFTFAIPFTHTGLLLSYPISETISVTGGPIVGWDNVATNNNGWNGIGNITWTATKELVLAANLIGGPTQNNNVGNKRVVADLVGTYKPCDPMTISLNYDYGHEDNAAADGGDASWTGVSGVVAYNFTDRFSASGRLEFFNDTDGFRTGVRQTLYEWTATAKYLVTQHLYALAEFRQDFSNKDAFQAGHTRLADDNPLVGIYATYVFN
jgi:hypothetical protein